MKQKILFFSIMLLMIAPTTRGQIEYYTSLSGTGGWFPVKYNLYPNTQEAHLVPYDIGDSLIVPMITSLNIPSWVIYEGTTYTLTRIYAGVFFNGWDLQTLTIPSTVRYIQDGALALPELTTLNYNPVRLEPNYDDYEYDDYNYEYDSPLFTKVVSRYRYDDDCECDVEYYDTIRAPITALNIGNGVKAIPSRFMENISTLTSISIPNSIDTIGEYAFCKTGISTLTIPSNVKYIGWMAFFCPNLTTVNYNATNIRYYNNPFNSAIYFNYIIVCDTAVRVQISTLNIGNGVRRIPNDFMCGITTVTSVSLPNTVDTIGDRAFANTGITSITIPDSVVYIGDKALACPNLTTLNYNANKVRYYSSPFDAILGRPDYTIWDYVYDTIQSPINTLNIGNRVNRLPDSFMEGMNALTSVAIPNSVDTIGERAFCRTGLTSITIPDSVKSIGSGAFACPNLCSVQYNAIEAHYDQFNFLDDSQSAFSSVDSYYWSNDTLKSPITTLNIGNIVKSIPDYFVDGCGLLI